MIMNNIMKKIVSYALVLILLALTIVELLGIWGVIQIELMDVIKKVFLSVFVVFLASVVVLFIFSVIIRDNKPKNNNID